MKYRKIGKWGVKLSVIGLGSYLTIGNKIDKKNARDTIYRAYDGGVNFFDTADAYYFGKAEVELGENLSSFSRHTIFLISKCWAPMSNEVNDRGL